MSAQPARKAEAPEERTPDSPSRPQDKGTSDLQLHLSSHRTRLSFQRTRMSADRTLMSIIRTSLTLIGFGFTIFQFFRFVRESVDPRMRASAANNFGLTLVLLGILLLAFGIVGHIRFMLELRRDHARMVDESLIPSDRFPYSVTLAAAILLLVVGLLASTSMIIQVGPFH